MNKRLWIQDFEHYQELFYNVKENVKYLKNLCTCNCEFANNFYSEDAACILFSEQLENVNYSHPRLKKCIRIFGE